MLKAAKSQVKHFPPYSRRRAIKLLTDYESAVREHEMLGTKHPSDQDAILKFYEDQRQLMLQLLTGTKE